MGPTSTAMTATALLAVVGGALLLSQDPADDPPEPPERLPTTEVSVRTTYTWPTGRPVEVLRAFAGPPEPWLAGHRGADLAFPAGAQVRAAADGVVAFAGPVAGRGVVSVDHLDGLRTTYEPVTAVVARGEPVTGGQVVGILEAGGHHCTPAPCLHWGARRGTSQYVDPMLLLDGVAVIRLLPEHRS